MTKRLTVSSTQPAHQVLQYGEHSISYQVFFVSGQKPKVIIDVLPNGMVHVKAPIGATLTNIKQAIQKRARWIHSHIVKIRKNYSHVLPRHYVSGECHFYLGRRYVLKVIKVKHAEQSVKLLRGQLQVRTQSREPEVVKGLLNAWYREHAKKVFTKRLEVLVSQISWLKAEPRYSLRSMKKQWGSCSPKGAISLNPTLVKAPRECIDYVIIHELCHIREHNHSQKYYKLLKRLAPNWERIKARLDGMAELLLSE